ncbi:polysaccharide export outer membrane protein [Pseudoduganella lurida]|uniref:Polysaccharide export outer membrane protein n=1 Tax=Pseudoduganella lurida TaxID=1036180 RepID=A0A562R9Q7_9BURK|nr:polysaccharide export protein EpsE [Pseudoduganella lurida]TWI65150.1 polysaccharide export outer membrane protein [Pseudoduganella lurida]
MKPFLKWMLGGLLGLIMGWASAADFTLGPGDVVKISVYGSPDLGIETRISEMGAITFPLVGQVDVNGLDVASAEKKLGAALERGGFLKKPQVNIIVSQIQSRQVSVLGQVNRPGRFPLEGKRSVMDLLALAGGFGQDGGDTISLIRKRDGNVTKTVIDVVDMVRTGQLSKDLDLEPNDIIYAERSPRFYIYGEVQRPGAFRLERQMTVIQALAVGGGLTPRGTERGIRVKRRGADGKEQIVQVQHDDLLQVDDVVYVKESWF